MNTVKKDYREMDRALAEHVTQRVSRLQSSYKRNDADAVAAVARLRRGVGHRAGSLMDLWDLTFDKLPEILSDQSSFSFAERDGAPTSWEQAAHDAITLHAWHQQSKSESMHQRGATFGGALRLLGYRTSEDAVRRRFQALGASDHHEARLILLRGLISQLRAQSIALDYGSLARDLRQLDHGTSTDQVMLRWGRDYHLTKPDDTDPGDADTTPVKGEDQ